MRNIKNVFVILGKMVLFIIFLLIFLFGISNMFGRLLPGDVSPNFVERLLFIIQTISVILAILSVYAIFDKRKGLYLGWGQRNKFGLLIEGCLWGIALITSTFILLWMFRGISITGICFQTNTLKSILFPLILFMFVSINEELLNRGYFYGLIKRDFGWVISITVNSILFSILHISNPSILQSPFPLLNLFLAGILFGVARETSGGLWVPIGIHFTWNFFLGNIYGLAVSGMDIGGSIIKTEVVGHPLITGGGFGPEGSVITSFVIVLYTIGIWKWYSNKGLKESI